MAAGDFTNLRAESISYFENVIRWSYAGTAQVTVWRAPHGGAFTQLNIPGNLNGATPLIVSPFTDDSAVQQTYYDYKVSDDGGATFSPLVSVQTQKQFPSDLQDPDPATSIHPPQFVVDEDVNAQNVQQLSDAVQAQNTANVQNLGQACEVCSTNGALIIDCSQGCFQFNVTFTEDINSISVNCPDCIINFTVPPGDTGHICGFPTSFGATGDECQTPIDGGGPPVIIDIQPPVPGACQNTATRYPKKGCRDYIVDCYDTGSYEPSVKLNGARATGCVNGDIQRFLGFFNNEAEISMLVKSGNLAKKIKNQVNPLAGFSVWFGDVTKEDPGAAGAPVEFEGTIVIESAPIGKPIVGYAFNVATGSTVDSFTGHIFELNYQLGQSRIVKYTAQNLRTATPTVLQNGGALPNFAHGQVALFISNFPSIAYFEAAMYAPAAFGATYTTIFLGTGYVGPNTVMGAGLVWIGNNATLGLHTAKLKAGVKGSEDFNFWPSA